jgi:hypothetical protein
MLRDIRDIKEGVESGSVSIFRSGLYVLFVAIVSAFVSVLAIYNTDLQPKHIVFIVIPFFGLIGATVWARAGRNPR